MRKFLLAAFLAFVFLFATNPGPDQHRTRFRERFREAHPVASFFGVDRLGSAVLSYQSYGLFSVTWFGDGLTTFGAAGIVFVPLGR
jgi:hypothetical protein